MARIVLLGLGNEDVDVLSRLSQMEPIPEVLAVHPDPEALILRLAAVASYPALTEPPRPRADDIVVVPSTRGPLDAQMVRPWRDMGARILLPDAPDLEILEGNRTKTRIVTERHVEVDQHEDRAVAGMSGGSSDTSNQPEESEIVAQDSSGSDRSSGGEVDVSAAGGEAGRMPGADEPSVAREDPAPAGPAPGAPDPDAPVQERPAPETPNHERPAPASPNAPPASVWESPEDTFRYLAEETLGRDRAVSLWWDGGAGVWVPWVWTGSVPERRPDPPDYGLEVPSRWGSFRLGVSADDAAKVPLNAISRVAEDLALRDIMAWREDARRFAAHGLPDAERGSEDLKRWAEPIFSYLEVGSALMWKREGDRYRLLHAQGEGVDFDGTLVMPATLVAATFETDAAGWGRWDPTPEIRVHLRAEGRDPRWALRLRRLELALAGEETGW